MDRGYSSVIIRAEGEIADVCRLTCIDNGISIQTEGHLPVLEVIGLKVHVHFPGELPE
jgi:hypothetical protein